MRKAYCERHDAYFNIDKDKWLEVGCKDPHCDFCRGRPDKPSKLDCKKCRITFYSGEKCYMGKGTSHRLGGD